MGKTRHQRQCFGRLLRKLGIRPDIIRAADGSSFFGNWLGQILLRKTEPPPHRQLLPLKDARLKELLDAGFNCPDFRSWPRNKLCIPELKELHRIHPRLSLRNFREEHVLEQTPKLPVAYDKNDWNFILDYCVRHNAEYHTLVNEALPLADSLLTGNIILLDERRYVVSYFEGRGTPRDVDDKASSELRVYLRPFGTEAPAWAPRSLDPLVSRLQAFRSDFRPMTFEFSLYPYPVGLHKRHEVFWEWRSGSTHDLYTVVTRLLERVDAHELTMHLPALVS